MTNKTPTTNKAPVFSSLPWAIVSLIIANVVPVFGVLFLNWSLSGIVVLYWAENGVIGVFTILKMLSAAKGGQQLASKLANVPFFAVHYGLFWFAHGVFVMTFFGPNAEALECSRRSGSSFSCQLPTPPASAGGVPFLGMIIEGVLESGILFALAGLFISHGVSFVSNYLGEREFLQATPRNLMFQPYPRVIIMHVTISVGAFFIVSLDRPLFALLLLVGLKTIVDLSGHVIEHAIIQRRTTKQEPPPATPSNTKTHYSQGDTQGNA